MSMQKNLKKIIEDIVKEIEQEVEESTSTGNIAGYNTPNAFSRKSDTARRKKTATQFGYKLVDNDVNNIDEGVWTPEQKRQVELLDSQFREYLSKKGIEPTTIEASRAWKSLGFQDKMRKIFPKSKYESVSESKSKRPVNRWLELKNDETMHPHKKMAHGLKELKYQLAETEKFFRWYNQIKTMNELDSTGYWKRTQNHIYKIKERLINIAKTLQEIEK